MLRLYEGEENLVVPTGYKDEYVLAARAALALNADGEADRGALAASQEGETA